MKNKLLNISLTLAGSLLLTVMRGYGQIEGSVMDSTRQGIMNATVIVIHSTSTARDTARSDKRGFYIFKKLPPGKYKVEARAPGFQNRVIENIIVNTNDPGKEPPHHDISNDTRLEIILKPLKGK